MSDGLIGAASILTRTSLTPREGTSTSSNLETKQSDILVFSKNNTFQSVIHLNLSYKVKVTGVYKRDLIYIGGNKYN